MVRTHIRNIVRRGHFEDLQFGMHSYMLEELESAVDSHGTLAITEIGHVIRDQDISSELRGFILNWLGSLDLADLDDIVLGILIDSLDDPSPWVRDGAGLGIAQTEDIRALPYLEQAIEREQLKTVKQGLQQVYNSINNECR